jgi:long-chain fatty acid transport protein
MNCRTVLALSVVVSFVALGSARQAHAQAFGVELHNTLMPASGGMAGTSIAKPQDVQSAFANPATLTQYRGTQFGFGGAWAEPTLRIDNNATLNNIGVDPYSAKSGRPGSALGNIAATQDFSAFGKPVTVGMGLLTASGLGINYRAVEESNGTSAELVGLAIASVAGVQLTDRLSAGVGVHLTSATLDGPFSGIGAAVPAYALRGIVGATYEVTDCTTLGFHWWTNQSFKFTEAVILQTGPFNPQDLDLDLPETFGFGIANNRLMNGRLLLAADILYKRWSDADFFDAIWTDQFVLQLGSQYTTKRGIQLRMGYSYAENITRDLAALALGGVIPPDGLAGVQYIQAQFPAINQHRITAGVGMNDVLPGIDFDLFAGGMFNAEQAFGDTTASVAGYWVGAGLTWRFRRGSCGNLPVADQWK